MHMYTAGSQVGLLEIPDTSEVLASGPLSCWERQRQREQNRAEEAREANQAVRSCTRRSWRPGTAAEIFYNS